MYNLKLLYGAGDSRAFVNMHLVVPFFYMPPSSCSGRNYGNKSGNLHPRPVERSSSHLTGSLVRKLSTGHAPQVYISRSRLVPVNLSMYSVPRSYIQRWSFLAGCGLARSFCVTRDKKHRHLDIFFEKRARTRAQVIRRFPA